MKNLIKLAIAITLITAIAPYRALAHGEDKPGPHGGFIKMPGAFHTEVVPVDESSFKVYLLDILFTSPVTSNSWVKASLINGETRTKATCNQGSETFNCTLPQGVNLNAGRLEVQAQRGEAKGISMAYELPLQHEKTNNDRH